MIKHVLIGITALGFAAGPALAQDTAPTFTSLDTDGSASISMAEAQVAWPELTAEAFAAADTNADGVLDQAEFDAFVATLPAAQ